MAEFKVCDEITEEIADARRVGELINEDFTDISSKGVRSLETASKIISQHKKIREILETYKSLVTKDMNDIDNFVLAAKDMDEKLSQNKK